MPANLCWLEPFLCVGELSSVAAGLLLQCVDLLESTFENAMTSMATAVQMRLVGSTSFLLFKSKRAWAAESTRELKCNHFAEYYQVYMTGGAGYALSREAARMFVAGHSSSSKCRPGDEGPEDVEMSRCLQRLGASFVDTRDKMGRYECISYSEKILDYLILDGQFF